MTGAHKTKAQIDPKLLEILVCPLTRGPLILSDDGTELISVKARLAYPIRDAIPVMLPDDARTLTDDECQKRYLAPHAD